MHGEEPLGQGGTNSCCCCRINSTNIHKLSCISSISTTTTSTSSSSTRTNNSANPHCNIGKDRKRERDSERSHWGHRAHENQEQEQQQLHKLARTAKRQRSQTHRRAMRRCSTSVRESVDMDKEAKTFPKAWKERIQKHEQRQGRGGRSMGGPGSMRRNKSWNENPMAH